MRMLMINVLLPHTSFVIYNLDEDEDENRICNTGTGWNT